MFAWVGAALGIFNKLLSAVGWFQKRSDEGRQREAGATAQKNVDLEKAVATKDAQLEIASKPDETREELLAKAKKRKRNA
jgi:hypothetical protein